MRSSLCATPIACMGAALLVAPFIRSIDQRTQWTLLHFGVDGSRLVTGALVSSLLTLIVFAFSIILLAIQIAGGQYSPRIISRVLESRLVKLTLGAFVFSFTYTLAALGRIEERVPQLPVLVAVLSSLLSIALFLYLIQKTGQALRPIMILTGVAADTRTAIEALYPDPFAVPGSDFASMQTGRTILYKGPPGAVLAFDAMALLEIGGRAQCTIEIVPQIGDYLTAGQPFLVLHGAQPLTADEQDLRRCVALGPERVLDNDPAFGFRILVDIASKALSPAINDPTTGVLALDQIQHLLHLLSQRHLGTGVVRDSTGQVRLVYRVPGWEDYVTLALTEIRVYGATNPQVTRRLQAMLEFLVQVVPTERVQPLREELASLGRTIEAAFADPKDRILARVADPQGFGGRLVRPGRGSGR